MFYVNVYIFKKMSIKSRLSLLLFFSILLFSQCKKEPEKELPVINYDVISQVFGDHIDLNNLDNYACQTVPNYIQKKQKHKIKYLIYFHSKEKLLKQKELFMKANKKKPKIKRKGIWFLV